MRQINSSIGRYHNYLQLCPTLNPPDIWGAYSIEFDLYSAPNLVESYGVFTVVVELINQLAVRVVRERYLSDLSDEERYIPASMRDFCLDGWDVTKRLTARSTRIGQYYSVSMTGENEKFELTGLAAVILVARVGEPLAC